MTQPRAAQLGRAHHGQGERSRVNDRGRVRRAQLRPDDHAVGQPIEFGGHVSPLVTVGNDETAVRGHALIAPVAVDFPGQTCVQRKASPCERIERTARTPVERQKAAGLARGGRRHLGPFHDGHVDPAARQEIAGACANDATAADHDMHGLPNVRRNSL